jgi:hypothetical protein
MLADQIKGMPSDFGRKLQLKWDDTKIRVKVDLTVVSWEDEKQNLTILTNMCHPQAEGNVISM